MWNIMKYNMIIYVKYIVNNKTFKNWQHCIFKICEINFKTNLLKIARIGALTFILFRWYKIMSQTKLYTTIIPILWFSFLSVNTQVNKFQ